jgi:hypothetical protein
MNSSFRNSNLGFVLYALIVFIIVTVLTLITWYMLWGYRNGTYSEGTILGSVYLGGLQEEQVDGKVNEKIDVWLDDPTIVFELTYQNYTYEFDRDLFYFNIQLSKNLMEEGQTNTLHVEYQQTSNDFQDTIDEIYNLPFLDGVKDNVDIEALINEILDDAGLMKTFSSKPVEDFLIEPMGSNEDLNSIEIDVPEGVSVDEMIAGVEELYNTDSITLVSNELFDIVAALGSDFNSQEMTILSTGILNLSHNTNFNIHEVHYLPRYDINGYNINTFYFGSNASVNTVVDQSFSVYNPNNSDYYVRVEKVDYDTVRLVLNGLPFVDTITSTTELTEIDYITQYTDDDSLLSSGKIGVVATVTRTIINLDGETIFDKQILFEFYPPVSQILLEQTPE